MNYKTNLAKTKYFELLEKEITLNKDEKKELLSYQIVLEQQITYNHKNEYFSLVDEYLMNNAGRDGILLFRIQFLDLYRNDMQALEILEDEIREKGFSVISSFSIESKSKEFYSLIEDIYSDCENVSFDLEDEYGISEDEFRKSLEKVFHKMKKYCNQ